MGGMACKARVEAHFRGRGLDPATFAIIFRPIDSSCALKRPRNDPFGNSAACPCSPRPGLDGVTARCALAGAASLKMHSRDPRSDHVVSALLPGRA